MPLVDLLLHKSLSDFKVSIVTPWRDEETMEYPGLETPICHI